MIANTSLPSTWARYSRPLRTWTGGSRPAPLASVSTDERAFVRELFRDQLTDHCGYWKCKAELDTVRTFWKRARYDAHATFRD